MKKFFICMVMAFIMAFGFNASAQVEPARFHDNTSIVLKGGANTVLSNSFDKVEGQIGLEVEKGITPWLGVALDGEFYISDYTHTAFDMVNINALAKFNVRNMFGKFDGTRHIFEPSVFTGIGWGHIINGNHFMTYKAGADFDFNLGKEKAWAIRVQPAVVWSTPNSGVLSKQNGWMELNVGVVYHFKNKDGNRTFTLVRRYDQAEVDELNGQINSLRSELANATATNDVLKTRLTEVPERITETVIVTDTVMLMPRVQFYLNSARILETTLGNVYDMAEYMKLHTDKTYTIVGYASVEGSESYNTNLSERRANALKDKLVEYGVDKKQLNVHGNGATDKFSKDSRSMNRVVIVEENR